MNCSQCGTENRDTARFCSRCGRSLGEFCGDCGFSISAGSIYCGGCGTEISRGTARPGPRAQVEQILRSQGALEGERKYVSVLFADLKDSISLASEIDVELSQRVLNSAVASMIEIVHRNHGMVNQVMGDGIMALFGAPLAQEYHAVFACRAAVAIQEAFGRANQATPPLHGAELHVRIGIHSGEVLVSAVHSDLTMEYRAIGATTHLASRMEQLAEPGNTFITEETMQLAEGFIRTRALGPTPIKGVQEPMPVYELTGVTAKRSRFGATIERGLTPFVGRNRELEQLQHCLQLAPEGRGGLVAVRGTAGVGKSRLVHEFAQTLADEECTVLQTGAYHDAAQSQYQPLIDLLRSWLGISEDDEAERIEAILRRGLDERGVDRPLALAALAFLFDVRTSDPAWKQLDPARRRLAVVDTVRALAVAEAQRRPLLLVFEDAQWSDRATLRVLESLVAASGEAPLFIVVTYRPEFGDELGAPLDNPAIAVELEALSTDASSRMFESLLGLDASLDSAKELLVQQTQGIPLYVEETVRSLAQNGIIVGEQGNYLLRRSIDDLKIPPTVQAVLAERIDRLPEEERRILQLASVIGNVVPSAVLRDLSGVQESELSRALNQLVRAEFLDEDRHSPSTTYTFRHMLTRDVAYGSMLRTQRRRIHARAVEAIERHYTDHIAEHFSRLADHALRGELWDKAVYYHVRACLRAIANSSNRQAVAIFERGIEAVEMLPEGQAKKEAAIDLRLIVQSALILMGDHDSLVTRLREAQTLAESIEDPRRMSIASAFLTVALWLAGSHERALQVSRQGIETAQSNDYPHQRHALEFTHGMVLHALGEFAQCIAIFEELLEPMSAEPPRLQGWVAYPTVFLHTFLVAALVQVGDYARARRHIDEGCRIADELEHPYSQVMIYDYLGWLYLLTDRPDRAVEALEHTWAICRKFELLTMVPAVAAHLGQAYTRCGRVDDAIQLLETIADPEVYRRGGQYTWAWLFLSLSETYLAGGRREDALECANKVLALTSENGERPHRAHALYCLANAESKPGENGSDEKASGRAAQHYREAIALGRELGMRPLLADACFALARLQLAGEEALDPALVQEAATLYDELELRERRQRVEESFEAPA